MFSTGTAPPPREAGTGMGTGIPAAEEQKTVGSDHAPLAHQGTLPWSYESRWVARDLLVSMAGTRLDRCGACQQPLSSGPVSAGEHGGAADLVLAVRTGLLLHAACSMIVMASDARWQWAEATLLAAEDDPAHWIGCVCTPHREDELPDPVRQWMHTTAEAARPYLMPGAVFGKHDPPDVLLDGVHWAGMPAHTVSMRIGGNSEWPPKSWARNDPFGLTTQWMDRAERWLAVVWVPTVRGADDQTIGITNRAHLARPTLLPYDARAGLEVTVNGPWAAVSLPDASGVLVATVAHVRSPTWWDGALRTLSEWSAFHDRVRTHLASVLPALVPRRDEPDDSPAVPSRFLHLGSLTDVRWVPDHTAHDAEPAPYRAHYQVDCMCAPLPPPVHGQWIPDVLLHADLESVARVGVLTLDASAQWEPSGVPWFVAMDR